jgi:hypothetical protein
VVDLQSECFTNHLKNNFQFPFNRGRPDITSDYAFSYTGLPEEPKPHDALTGAKMVAESLSRLIYGEKLLLEFIEYEIPDYLLKTQ